ncbi:MAG: hypothetical protein LiPW15_766 [Parcubacteria group bacterium LiPW_15]|nr:MAG: hypothetical protein LiPW15_766 [Parcubacteria group bacterium LiPW_15]
MKVSVSPKVRSPLILALGVALGCYFWETSSPWMGVEKFYRNTRLTGVRPVEIGFPKTAIQVDLSGQSALSLLCRGEVCKVRLVVFEKEFDLADRAILPNGYIPFLREGVILSDFRIVAYDVGSVSKAELREVFAAIRVGNLRRYKIERSVKDKRVARVLTMHFMEVPLRLELRPESRIAEFYGSGLKITILTSITELEFAN